MRNGLPPSSSSSFPTIFSVAKGPKIRPLKRPQKIWGARKTISWIVTRFAKKGRIGAKLFQNSCLRDNLWIFRDKCIFIPTLSSYSYTIFKFSGYFFLLLETSFHVGLICSYLRPIFCCCMWIVFLNIFVSEQIRTVCSSLENDYFPRKRYLNWNFVKTSLFIRWSTELTTLKPYA
jgi:hypothetical protein